MKRLQILLLTAVIASIALFGSCKKTSAAACGTLGWGLQIQDELVALSDAGSAYGQDPSSANCENYKDAYRDYIRALKDIDRCVVNTQERKEFLEALEDAENDLDDLC